MRKQSWRGSSRFKLFELAISDSIAHGAEHHRVPASSGEHILFPDNCLNSKRKQWGEGNDIRTH